MVQAPGHFAAHKNLTFSQYHRPIGLNPRFLSISPYQGPGPIPGNLAFLTIKALICWLRPMRLVLNSFWSLASLRKCITFSQCFRNERLTCESLTLSQCLAFTHLPEDLTLSRPLPVSLGTHSNLTLSQCFGPALRRTGARVNAEPRARLLLNVLDPALGTHKAAGRQQSNDATFGGDSSFGPFNFQPSPCNLQPSTFNFQPATFNLQQPRSL